MHLKLLFSALFLMLITLGASASDSREPYSINEVTVTTWNGLKSAVLSSGTIILGADITAPADATTLTINEGIAVTLNLNNHTITGKSDIVIFTLEGGDLTITDSGTKGLITGASIGVFNSSYYNGTCTMEAGTIANNTWGVVGAFVMKNGSVINNTNYNLSGDITIYDGLIGGENSDIGIWLDINNDCNMYGGTIYKTKKWAIDMNTSTGLNMYGGSIIDNLGGGIRSKGYVYLAKSSFGNYDDIIIQGNANGGILNVGEYAKCYLTAGTISGNNEFGVKSETTVINIGGSLVIKDNVKDGTLNGHVYTGGTPSNLVYNLLSIYGDFTDEADIRVEGKKGDIIYLSSTVYVGNYTHINAAKIHNSDGTLSGSYQEGNIRLGLPIKATLASAEQEYSGNAIVPSITVTDGSTTLVENTDYSILYYLRSSRLSEIVSIGEYMVAVVGKGNYGGYATFTFNITKATATIKTAPAAISDLEYTGEAQTLITQGTANVGEIVYCLDKWGYYYSTLPQATKAGEYIVYYQIKDNDNLIGTDILSVKASIAKAQNKITTESQAIKNLVYNGKSQTLISEPAAKYGKFTYSIGENNYTTLPTAKNAGTYTIKYQVAADDNYTGVSSEVTVTIAKADNEITEAPSAVNKLIEDGTEHNLVWQGEALSGTILYSLDGTNYSSTIPTAVAAGEYTVYYKVEEDNNYNAIAPASIKVTVAEKEVPKPTKQAYALLEGKTLTFYYGEEKPAGALPIRTSSDDSSWPSSMYSDITTVVFDESFKEYKPTSLTSWFLGFEQLTQLTGMENITTDDVESMYEMFQFCDNLKSVDFSSFNTSNVTDMRRVFWGCNSLESVFVGEGWSISAVQKSSGMFEDCFVLHGGKGTSYNADITDVTYARIDGGTETPGYLTKSGESAFKKTVVSITVSTSPTTEYTQGDDFSADNGKLTIKYNDNTTETKSLSDATITGYDKTKVGEQTLKIVYQGVETTLTVTVKAKEQNNNNENPNTPVSSVDDAASVKVWSFNSTIYIETAPDTKYTIIDLNGRILKSSTTSSSKEEIRLNQSGIVVVIINNASYKLAL